MSGEDGLDKGISVEQPSPVELANSWLDYRSLEVRSQLAAAIASQEFLNNYSQEPPPSTPNTVEAGSLDADDWETARLEYAALPFEIAQESTAASRRVRELTNEQETIVQQRDLVATGDKNAVTTFSSLEKNRRAALEAAKRREEARKLGIELPGVEHLTTSLSEITHAVRTGQLHTDTETPNGWRLVRHMPREENNFGGLRSVNPEQIQLSYNPDPEFPRNNINVRLYPRENEYELDIEDFTHPQEAASMYGHGRTARQGRGTSFTVRDRRVYNPEVRPVLEETMWGYPETHKQSRGMEQTITEQQFDGITMDFQTLASDIQTLPPQNAA